MLTREEILAVPVGRKLDAWVAEHIMGIPVVSDGEEPFAPFAYDFKFGVLVKQYSLYIAAAWEVVEKMTQDWPDFSVGKTHEGWCVSWGFDGHGWEWVEGCETAPLAICRAALLTTLK